MQSVNLGKVWSLFVECKIRNSRYASRYILILSFAFDFVNNKEKFVCQIYYIRKENGQKLRRLTKNCM